MSNDHFSNRIKEHEAPLDPGAWSAMEALLDGNGAMPAPRSSGRKYMGLILLLAILTGAGLYGLGAFDGFQPDSAVQTLKENNTAAMDLDRSAENAADSGSDSEFSAENAERVSPDSRTAAGVRKPAEVETTEETDNKASEASDLEMGVLPTSGDNTVQEAGSETNQGQSSHELMNKDEGQAILDKEMMADIHVEADGSEPSPINELAQKDGEGTYKAGPANRVDKTLPAEIGIQTIEPSIRPGIGGSIPSGITSIGMSLYESRLKVPSVAIPSLTNPIPIQRVSFYAGYTQVSTDVIVSTDNELTGHRFNVGISYWLTERLSLETEFGNASLSLATTVANGTKHESMRLNAQHVHLKYRFLETRTFDLKFYGGVGYGKFVYEWYIRPTIGPVPSPSDRTKESSNIATLDFGLSVLCKWGDFLVMETQLGIMHNDAFSHGSIMDNYGVNFYWTPRRKVK